MSGAEFAGTTYRAMFQWLPVPVALLDDELKIVLANAAACQLLRLRKGGEGLALPSLVRQKSLDDLIRNFGGKQTKTIEVSIPGRRWAAPRALRITMRRLLSERPTRRGGRSLAREFRLLVLEDVTSRMEIEEQLMQAEKLAGMGQLAAGVAHELANPLSSMASNVRFLGERITSDDAALSAVKVTAECLDDMQQLLEVLSGFTRPLQPRYEAADLHDLIRRAMTFIAKDAENHGIQLSAAFAPMAMECEMDVRIIKRVLLNLLKNAMEAMPKGGRLEIKTRVDGAPGEGAAIVEVSDTGLGIADSDQRRVFRPLFSTKPRGTGLGLPFCRHAVEEHGGEIRLLSRQGSGTTVTFSIPFRQATAD